MESEGGEARRRVQGPAVGLIVVGVLTILSGLGLVAICVLLLVLLTFPEFKEQQLEQLVQNARLQKPWMTQQDEKRAREQGEATLNYVAAVYGVPGALSLLLGVLILWGAISMLRLRSYAMGMTSAIAALLPCSCCLVSLPMGIWALVALNHPDVRMAFEEARADRF